MALMPGNFSAAAGPDDFQYHAAAPDVRSAWQRVGLEDEGPLGTSPKSKVESPKSMIGDEQIPLTVFFGTGVRDGVESLLAVALSAAARVLAEPCYTSSGNVQLDLVVARPGARGCVCIEYRGDAFGIVALARDVRGIWAGQKKA